MAAAAIFGNRSLASRTWHSLARLSFLSEQLLKALVGLSVFFLPLFKLFALLRLRLSFIVG